MHQKTEKEKLFWITLQYASQYLLYKGLDDSDYISGPSSDEKHPK